LYLKKTTSRYKSNFIGYFAKTLTDAATKWFDAPNLENISDIDALYTDLEALYAE